MWLLTPARVLGSRREFLVGRRGYETVTCRGAVGLLLRPSYQTVRSYETLRSYYHNCFQARRLRDRALLLPPLLLGGRLRDRVHLLPQLLYT